MPETKYIDRPPRIQPQLPRGVEVIPPPPKVDENQTPAWQAAVPVVTIIGYVLVSAFGRGGSSLVFILPMAMAVFISTSIAIFNAVRAWQIRREKQKTYDLRLKRLRREMKITHDQQRAFYNYNYPETDFIMKMDGVRMDNRGGSRLWERRTSDADFGHIRIGIGVRQSTVAYRISKQGDNDENPQMYDAERLEADSLYVDDVPIILPLYQNPALGDDTDKSPMKDGEALGALPDELAARGTIGIASSNPEDIYPFINSVFVHLAGLHSPNDLQMFVLGTRNVVRNWYWAYEIPHCMINPNDGQTRLYFEDIERLTSPIDGHVVELFVQQKDPVKPGTPVARIRAITGDLVDVYAEHYGRVQVIAMTVNQFVKQGQMLLRTGDFALTPQQLDEERDPDKPFQYQQGKQRERQSAGVPTYWKEKIWRELDRRERRLRDRDENDDTNIPLPFMVLVVDLMESDSKAKEYPEAMELDPKAIEDPLQNSWLYDMESEASMALIMGRAAELGIATLFLVPDRHKIPSGCQSVLELTRDADQQLRFLYAETGLNTQRYVGVADEINRNPRVMNDLQQFVQNLSKIHVRRSYGADIPRRVGLFPLYKAGIIGYQNEENGLKIAERWMQSLNPDRAEWPKIPLGIMAGQEPRELHFFADADGVHGMIAGSTGSGKSELLMTLILSLAVKYDPTVVNFVLIDFKGGAAFEPFKSLPHVVDIVTNLRGNAVARMFAAINAELNRRQDINQRTDSKDIVRYRKKGLHIQRNDNYPHLFIIIDEFAEMIANNPEYRAQLDSITRLGRALGVSLILAAQRPSGVTDQMRANIKFRICLRVETKEESQELLRLPDASYLPSIPGRGYLQVGSESLELIQVGYTGMTYDDPRDYDSDERFSDMPVIWEEMLDQDVKEPMFEVLVRRLKNLTGEKYPQVDQHTWRKPWPDSLPPIIALDSPEAIEASYIYKDDADFLNERLQAFGSASQLVLCPEIVGWREAVLNDWQGADWERYAMQAVVGLVDDPGNAQLRLLKVDFRQGHYAMFGAAGAGKTTLLRSILTNLVASHSPIELNLYLLDFGANSGLRVFEDLPHTGAYIQPHESERIERLLRMIDQTIEQRKDILYRAKAEDLYTYNTNNPDSILPAMLVVVDNFASFRQDYEIQIDDILMSQVREGLSVGIHFLFSGEQMNAVGRMFNLLPERITLRLSDEGEYSSIVGKGVRSIDEIEGRGIVRMDRVALEAQVAMPVQRSGIPDTTETDDLEAFLHLLRQAGHQYVRPLSITELEEWATLENLRDDYEQQCIRQKLSTEEIVRRGVEVVIGRDDYDLSPAVIDLDDKPHFVITGSPSSGKTNAMQAWILCLSELYRPDEVGIVMVDYQRRVSEYGGNKYNLEKLPHMLMPLVDSPESFEQMAMHLDYEMTQNARRDKSLEIFVFIDNYSETDIDELSGKNSNLLQTMGKVARFGKETRIHFILGIMDSDLRNLSMDPLFKRVAGNRFGLAMNVEAAAGSPFYANVPRRFNNIELPRGRGFIAYPGSLRMVQVAVPCESEATKATDMDTRVEQIILKYKNQRAAFLPLPQDRQPLAQSVSVQAQTNGPGAGNRESASVLQVALTDQQRDCILLKLAIYSKLTGGTDAEKIELAQASFSGSDNELLNTASALDIDYKDCIGE